MKIASNHSDAQEIFFSSCFINQQHGLECPFALENKTTQHCLSWSWFDYMDQNGPLEPMSISAQVRSNEKLVKHEITRFGCHEPMITTANEPYLLQNNMFSYHELHMLWITTTSIEITLAKSFLFLLFTFKAA